MLRAHYNSYLAGSVSVYNPVSIMSAFEQASIEKYWVATGLLMINIMFFVPLSMAIGDYPLICQNFPDNNSALDVIEKLLSGDGINLTMKSDITFSRCVIFPICVLMPTMGWP